MSLQAIAPVRMTTKETAEYTGVSEPTLETWRCLRRHPELAYIKVGRRVYYLRKDVDAWLDSRRVGGLPAEHQAAA